GLARAAGDGERAGGAVAVDSESAIGAGEASCTGRTGQTHCAGCARRAGRALRAGRSHGATAGGGKEKSSRCDYEGHRAFHYDLLLVVWFLEHGQPLSTQAVKAATSWALMVPSGGVPTSAEHTSRQFAWPLRSTLTNACMSRPSTTPSWLA